VEQRKELALIRSQLSDKKKELVYEVSHSLATLAPFPSVLCNCVLHGLAANIERSLGAMSGAAAHHTAHSTGERPTMPSHQHRAPQQWYALLSSRRCDLFVTITLMSPLPSFRALPVRPGRRLFERASRGVGSSPRVSTNRARAHTNLHHPPMYVCLYL
jgi:hypothetical protein